MGRKQRSSSSFAHQPQRLGEWTLVIASRFGMAAAPRISYPLPRSPFVVVRGQLVGGGCSSKGRRVVHQPLNTYGNWLCSFHDDGSFPSSMSLINSLFCCWSVMEQVSRRTGSTVAWQQSRLATTHSALLIASGEAAS